MEPHTKQALRAQILRQRAARGPVRCPELPLTGTIAAFLPIPGESDPSPLLAHADRVLLPRMLPDGSLEFCPWSFGEALRTGPMSTREPVSAPVSLHEATVVLVPALAVDPLTGVRLGRGAGCYDRTLADVSMEARWAVLADESELFEGVPADPHDQRVSHVVLPGVPKPIRVGPCATLLGWMPE